LDDSRLAILIIAIVVLVACSAFFSGAETGLMSLNRYRLAHRARSGDRRAIRTLELLKRPDRLLGLILLGNNFVNNLGASLATVLAVELMGEAGVAVATAVITLVFLLFAEVTPKTLGALHPERIALPATLVLTPLLRLLYPLVWLINAMASVLLRPLGIRDTEVPAQALSSEELRSVVLESGKVIPRRHQRMLLSILELEEVTVEDIMVPRNEIVGIDLDDDWDTIVKQITHSQYTKLLVFRGDVDHVIGFLHLRKVLPFLQQPGGLNREGLEALVREAYFIPEGTPLNAQLLAFQSEQRRIGLVVDEYGDLLGLVTLEDILEEIVGEFTTDPTAGSRGMTPTADGGYLIDGVATVRKINRKLGWELPTDGPKTLNGLIMESLDSIPEPGTSVLIAGHPVEIVKVAGNRVKTARVGARLNS